MSQKFHLFVFPIVLFGLQVIAQSPDSINATTTSQNPNQAPVAQVGHTKTVSRVKCSPNSMNRRRTFELISLNKLPGVPRAAVLGSRVQSVKGHTFGAYWQLGGGFTSTVILRNKDPQSPVMANVVVFSHDGTIEQTVPLKVGPNSVGRLALEDVVKVGNESAHWGGLMLEFPNVFASTTVGSVIIENYQKGTIFDLPFSGGFRYDTRNALHAPWWLIDGGTDGSVTLFNVSNQAIVVTPSIIAAGGERTIESLNLAAHGTKKLSIREMLRQQGVESAKGSIALRYTGPAHALAPALLLANPTTGFSLVSPFSARRDRVEFGQAVWRFPDVFLSADPQFGFTEQRLTAYAIVSNLSKSLVLPQLTAFVDNAANKSEGIPLPIKPLKPLETRVINLSRFVESGLLPRAASYISLAVAHKGVPGDLGLTVFTVGESKDFVSRSEGLVKSGQVIDSTYWDVAGDFQALLIVQNAGDSPVQSKATLYYQTAQGPASYTLRPIGIPGNGSKILNLKQIVRSGMPDPAGVVIPANITFGTLTLEVADKASHGLIFGGSASFDPVKGRYGLGSLPPNCDLCDPICEFCDEPTDTGGVCEPDCSDPSCCGEPPLSTATYFQATGADPLLSSTQGVCPFGFIGSGFRVHYQLLDQNGSVLLEGGATPLETVVENGVTTFAGAPFASPQQTNSDGTFDDFPLVTCFKVPLPANNPNPCVSVNQVFDLDPGDGGPVLPISTSAVSRQCAKGISLQVLGNPVPAAFSVGQVN